MASRDSGASSLDQHLHLHDNLRIGVHSVAKVTTQAETIMWCEKNTKAMRQLVEMICHEEFDKATKTMRNIFPGAVGSPSFRFFVDEIVRLVCLKRDEDYFLHAIEWVKSMSAEMQVIALNVLYDLLVVNERDEQPYMLLLLRSIDKVPCHVFDQALLQDKCRLIVKQIVCDIMRKDISRIVAWANIRFGVVAFIMPQIVYHCDVSDISNLIQLVNFGHWLMNVEDLSISSSVVSSVLKELEERQLLDSIRTLHLWPLALLVKERQNLLVGQHQQLFAAAFQRLSQMKHAFFLFYKNHVENRNSRRTIQNLHKQNPLLLLAVPEFLRWYLNGDPSRTANVSAAEIDGLTFSVLEDQTLDTATTKMASKRAYNTFAGFCDFIMLKHLTPNQLLTNRSLDILRVEIENLQPSGLFDCLDLVHQSSSLNQKLQLVNKHFGQPLCVHQEQVFCRGSVENRGQLCVANVDLNSYLTTFTFQSAEGEKDLQLLESTDGMVKTAANGSHWMIKAVDKNHVKIFSANDKFLTLGKPSLDNDNKRFVYLTRETLSDKQLWNIKIVHLEVNKL